MKIKNLRLKKKYYAKYKSNIMNILLKKLRDTPNHCFLCKVYTDDGKKVIRRIKKYTKYICNDCIKKHNAKDRVFVVEEKILVEL